MWREPDAPEWAESRKTGRCDDLGLGSLVPRGPERVLIHPLHLFLLDHAPTHGYDMGEIPYFATMNLRKPSHGCSDHCCSTMPHEQTFRLSGRARQSSSCLLGHIRRTNFEEQIQIARDLNEPEPNDTVYPANDWSWRTSANLAPAKPVGRLCANAHATAPMGRIKATTAQRRGGERSPASAFQTCQHLTTPEGHT